MSTRSAVRLGWGEVSYLEWPAAGQRSGSTVVLLHGGGVDSAALSWSGLGPRLAAAGHRVLAPDHPGYGFSPPAPWTSTQDRLVDYVGEFVDALELDGYALGGLSLGGGMTIGHVLARPERVTGALLLGSYGIMPRLSDGRWSLARQILTWAMVRTGSLTPLTRWLATRPTTMAWSMVQLIRDERQRTPELLAEVLDAARAGHGFAEFGQWQRDQVLWNRLRTDYTPALVAFPVPALIVHGDLDPGVPVAHARTAARLIPEARLEIVPGAGHWVQRDRPDQVLAAMTDFLSGLAAPA